ncbi:MAG: OmpA family protein [Deltaproteobacteria bacterium]|nr:OmpA family protein [Deltaproteobacteria bacterium]
MFARVVGIVAFLAVVANAPVTLGQVQTETSFDVQQFQPSPHGNAFFTVESANVPKSLDVRAQLYLIYAYRPLQLVSTSGARLSGIVDHRFDANLGGAISLWDRLSIGLSVPMALYQGATLTGVSGVTQALAAIAFGDMRLSLKGALLAQRRFQIDLAILFSMTVPTGAEGAFAGDRNVTLAPEVAIGRRFGPVRAAFNFGYLWRQRSVLVNLVVDPELYYRLGVGFDIQRLVEKIPLEVLGEIYGRTSAVTPFRNIEQNPLEWLLGARYAILKPLSVSFGFGRGFTNGYGSPAFRMFASLVFSPIMQEEKGPPKDTDKDGILDEDDDCLNEPEDKDGFEDSDGCPELDNDKDGVPDSKDKCPVDNLEDKDGFEDSDGCFDADNDKDGIFDATDECDNDPEDKDGFEDENGCPENDNDKDGFLDDKDKCPLDPEDKDGFEDKDGCSDPDNDKDGIVDAKDQCPNEAEVVNNFEDFDGCPDKGQTLVVVKEASIDILDKVHFETGSDKILKKSFALLNQVANTLKNHEEIGKIRVEGHTDDVGDDASNLKLSQRRAESVRTYLIGQGLLPDRLVAVGYGETKPIAPNSSKRGKEANRRVAFSILKD